MVWQEVSRPTSTPLGRPHRTEDVPHKTRFSKSFTFRDLSPNSKKQTMDHKGTLGGFWAFPVPSASQSNSSTSMEQRRQCMYLGSDADEQMVWNRRSMTNGLSEATTWTKDFKALYQTSPLMIPLTPPKTPGKEKRLEMSWVLHKQEGFQITELPCGRDALEEVDPSSTAATRLVELPDTSPSFTVPSAPLAPAEEESRSYIQLQAPFSAYPPTPSPNTAPSSKTNPLPAIITTFHGDLDTPINIPRTRPTRAVVTSYCTIQPLNPAVEVARRRGLHKVKAQHSLRKDRNASITSHSRVSASRRGSKDASSSSRRGSRDVAPSQRRPSRDISHSVPHITVTHPKLDRPVSQPEQATGWHRDEGESKWETPEDDDAGNRSDDSLKSMKEGRWEEITEPADLKVCLEVLRRKVERRRRVLRGGGEC